MNKFISKHRKAWVIIVSSIIWTFLDIAVYYATNGDFFVALIGIIPILIEKIFFLTLILSLYNLMEVNKNE